ncbi:hypothetical protein [Metabacillus iocasae]|uniref:Membrane protein n=1 Tax=Priestia iocasae TaxID=2291674 RepID=A0ABS2QSU1_9BACI|nr:hypothetical protein [Metabacillus iocasae]MBM7702535.1 putative membrane protein [Metabacillus iocasae]
MSDQVKLKQYIATLKSELEFYKEKYAERQKEQVETEDLEEKMVEMHKKYEKEKKALLEQIEVLKAFINDISTTKEEPKSEAVVKKEEEAVVQKEEETVVKKEEETEQLKKEVQQLTEQLQKVQVNKQPEPRDWFQRVISEQNKGTNGRKRQINETTFRSIQQKMDK